MTGHILIIDPVPINRIVLKAKLASAHYKTAVAQDLAEAVEIQTQTPLEGILISAALLEQDESEIADFLGEIALQPDHGVTAIFMRDAVAEADIPDLIARCHAVGGHDCVARPMSPDILLARLRNLMRDRARSHDLAHRSHEVPMGPSVPQPRPGVHIAFATIGATRMSPEAAAIAPWGQLSNLIQELPESDTLENVPLAALLQPEANGPLHGVMTVAAAHDATDYAISLISQLKSQSRLQATRLILTLDRPTSEQLARAFDLGADEALCGGSCGPRELAHRIDHQARLHCAELDRKSAVRDRLKMAITDPLTGLHNRRYASERLRAMQEDCCNFGHQLAVLALDIDHFKQVNDRYGHSAGDAILLRVAQTLNDAVRGSDLVARVGGEEFLIALPQTDRAQAITAANRLRRAVSALKTRIPGVAAPVRVTLSIGLALHDGTASIERMLEDADRALYKAKSRGRNLVSISAAA